MGVPEILALLLKFVEILEPAIAKIVQDWADGKVTAEEADAAANSAFSRMALALANPQADADALDVSTEKALEEKFPPTPPVTPEGK